MQININTGEKRIPVVRDGKNVGELIFNPSDTLFVEKLYLLIGDFQEKIKDYEKRAKVIDGNKAVDELGIARNIPDGVNLIKEISDYIKSEIDKVFGAGTSQITFGDAVSIDVFQQFFDGIIPYVKNEREKKIETYTNQKPKRPRK